MDGPPRGLSHRAALFGVCVAFSVGVIGSLALRPASRVVSSQLTDTSGATVRWRLPVAFGTNLPGIGDSALFVAEQISAVSGGRIEFEVFEPGEVVPALAITEAVSAGKVQAGYTWLGYDEGRIPASVLIGSVPFGMEPWEYMAWWYHGGGRALGEKIYAPHGVKPILCGLIGPESAGWFRDEIRELSDLRGLKIRFAGLGGKVMQRLGASVTMLPGGEILIRAADGDGLLRLLAVEPDGGTARELALPAGGPIAADVRSEDIRVDPLGARVLLLVDGVPTVAAVDGYAQLDRPLEFGEHLMGWAGDGGALVEHDAISHWDGTEGGSLTGIGLLDGIDGTSWDCATHPDGLSVFRIWTDGTPADSEGLAWYEDGQLTGCEMGLWSVSDPAFAHHTDGPVAVAHDSDWESPTRNQVVACQPDGSTREVLDAHGLRGHVLPSDRIW